MTVHNPDPVQIESSTFSNRRNAILYVPVGSKSAYEAADYWREFKEIIEKVNFIEFADSQVKDLCVANWDTNGDGELCIAEAAKVTSLGEVFKSNSTITSFDELQYFSGLTNIGVRTFDECFSLKSIVGIVV